MSPGGTQGDRVTLKQKANGRSVRTSSSYLSPSASLSHSTKRQSLQYITLAHSFLIQLSSLLSSFSMCAGWGWISHLSWLCFRNHRARVFLWSRLLEACSVLLHLRQGICWRVSEDPRLLLQSPSSLALSFSTLYLSVWCISWVLYSVYDFSSACLESVMVSGTYIQAQGHLY